MQALANLLGESALVGEKTGDVDPYFQFRPEVKEGEEGEEGKMDFEDIMSYLGGIEGQQADRAEHLRAQIAAQQAIDKIIPPPGSPGHKPNPTLAELGAQLNELNAQMEVWQGYADIQAQLDQTIQQYQNMGPQPDGAGGFIPGELTAPEVAMGIADAEQAYADQLPSGWDAFSEALGFGTDSIQGAIDQVSSQISAQTPTTTTTSSGSGGGDSNQGWNNTNIGTSSETGLGYNYNASE